ncbi:malto-oligosyltrehalose synthase [Pandoraea vervacti]|uniref:Malto-oligosyltrehalose synthase n=1 Tax=Pandoraea vervacti TaxID=656178 RepID=A0ABM5SYD2_9BURK|nr:malto-oligosyltrehalose synthase [Pandoraea vervacti]AJP57587.1 malto-oligosyltrehalose synthase [Pandoraea vervacti]
MTPLSTLRVQFNADYTFAHAKRDVPAFVALGISHLYASPVWTAMPGSTHGYDVADPGTVSDVLGGEAELRSLHDQLAAQGIGLVLDIVPNHMGNGEQNRWWQDVLRRGAQSPYARYFDIDWNGNADVPAGKVLLAVLPEPLADALARRKLSVMRALSGEASFAYDGARWPVAPETSAIAGDARAASDWQDVLARQHFHLTHWPLARDALNWRRFFDISSLVAVCVERPEVFEAVHALTLRLFADGVIDGVRIDHVDGLVDPGAYCRKLRAALRERANGRTAGRNKGRDRRRDKGRNSGHEPWIVVEKILMDGEHLDPRWETDGTTGYDFMNDVGALLHDSRGAAALDAHWRTSTGDMRDFGEHVCEARQQLLRERFGSEISRAVGALARLIDAHGRARDFGVASLRRCVCALASSFPVYRGYPRHSENSDAEKAIFTSAQAGAKRLLHPLDHAALAQLVEWLTPTEDPSPLRREAQIRFAQVTAPLAAKAVEDTAGYRWGRLLSRNDVGCDASRLAMPLDVFHQANAHRARHWPRAMLTTATHDHKRGEDVRARLAVLSEIPAQWGEAVDGWRAENERFRAHAAHAPDVAHELMLYQTLLGAWPCEWTGTRPAAASLRAFAGRIAQWQRKALREAGVRTSWVAPDAAYEDGCGAFLHEIMADPAFVASMQGFSDALAPAGALNGLTQTFLRLTCPGVPDTYQASLGWDQTLVDPDNRRTVHVDAVMSRLSGSGDSMAGQHRQDPQVWRSLMARWWDGDVKLALLCHLLHLRKSLACAFAHGDYVALRAHGPCEPHAIVFARVPPAGSGAAVLCVATRHAAHHLGATGGSAQRTQGTQRAEQAHRVPCFRPQDWQDTAIDASPVSRTGRWRNCLTGTAIGASADGTLPVAQILDALPVAVLTEA